MDIIQTPCKSTAGHYTLGEAPYKSHTLLIADSWNTILTTLYHESFVSLGQERLGNRCGPIGPEGPRER